MKEIRIDGVIGQGENEVTAEWVRAQLPTNATEPIRVSIHSEGGSVFEGFAIHDVLASYAGPKVVAVESTAFSIASFIAMAGDEIEMSPNAYFMLHNPRISVEGDDSELAKTAGMIADLKTNMVNAYALRMGKPVEQVQAILKEETYFNATDAVAAGLADRITQKAIKGRPLACLATMPHGVVSALFGAGSGGDNDSKKGHKMTESRPVAATVKEIKAAFPALAKAKPNFIIDCVERDMPLASVAAAAAEEMMKENDELKKQVTAMEEELTAFRAKAAEDEEKDPEAMEGEDDEEEKKEPVAPSAKSRGAKPVARATTGKPVASTRWKSLIEEKVAAGIPRAQAIMKVDAENPGLRQQYLTEVNAAR